MKKNSQGRKRSPAQAALGVLDSPGITSTIKERIKKEGLVVLGSGFEGREKTDTEVGFATPNAIQKELRKRSSRRKM